MQITAMKIRKISAVLIAVMLMSLLAGCGKKGEDSIESMENDYSKFVTLLDQRIYVFHFICIYFHIYLSDGIPL